MPPYCFYFYSIGVGHHLFERVIGIDSNSFLQKNFFPFLGKTDGSAGVKAGFSLRKNLIYGGGDK